ncbi:hypothetical protein ACAF76_003645 [Brevibacillus sp. TJ4]|uniref:hypothetical protein n=1 Tax=Brevibacillus sp. TJ4 TaxID=3234853 RepID=UPI003BA1F6AD
MEEKAFLEEEYGFAIHGQRDTGAGKVLETDQGLFYLYTAPANYKYKSKMVERIRQHLSQQPELGLLKLVQNRTGHPHVILEGQLYYVYRGVREANLQDPYFACGESLAHFHQATTSLARDKVQFAHSSLGNWPSMWGRRLREYNTYRDELDEGEAELTSLDEYLLTSYTYVHQLGETAIQYLQACEYDKVVKQTSGFGKVAYQNFDAGYIRWNEQNARLVGGEYNWVFDMRARDIGQWLKAESKRNGWQDEAAIRFLDGYNSVSPILEAEYAVIYALMLFPGRFLRLVESYQQLPDEERHEVDGPSWQAFLDNDLLQMEAALRRYPQVVAQQYGATLPQIDWLWRYEDEKAESSDHEEDRE